MKDTVTEYLDEAVECYPNKIAVVDSNRQLTFSELRSEVYCIAQLIIERQERGHKSVAIYLEDSVESIVSMFGVAYSGNYFTIINDSLPCNKIEEILSALEAEIIITDRKHEKMLSAVSATDKLILYDDIMFQKLEINKVKSNSKKTLGSDAFCIIFTSGSTGRPKGVIISHKTVIDHSLSYCLYARHNETDSFCNQFPLSSAAGLSVVYIALIAKGMLGIINAKYNLKPVQMKRLINEKKYSCLYLPMSALKMFAELNPDLKGLEGIKCIVVGGEIADTDLLFRFQHLYPNMKIINAYGATETFGGAINYEIKKSNDILNRLPIGQELYCFEGIILDENTNRITTSGYSGELCIRGSAIASGYWRDKLSTEKAFIQNPLNSEYQEMIYKTGDIVQYDEDGNLLYIGRKDFQINHRGHRIEPEEIELIVRNMGQVNECACIYDEREEEIVLVYRGDIEKKILVESLHNELPNYMFPERIIKVTDFPYNTHQKVNKIKLKELYCGEHNNI